MKLLKYIVFIALIFFSSCGVPKDIMKSQINKVTPNNLGEVNGIYNNLGDSCILLDGSIIKEQALWSHLKPFFGKDIPYNWKEAKFQIKIVDNKLITFELIDEAHIISTVRLKFKIKNGFLIVKHNSSLQGVPLVFYRFHKEVLYFSFDKNNNLKFNVNGTALGGIFIIGMGTGIYGSNVFRRADD